MPPHPLKTDVVLILLHRSLGEWKSSIVQCRLQPKYLSSCNANGDNVVSIVECQQGMACLFDVALDSLNKAANCISGAHTSTSNLQKHCAEGTYGVDIKEECERG